MGLLSNLLGSAQNVAGQLGGLAQAVNPLQGMQNVMGGIQTATSYMPSLPILTDSEISLMAVCIQGDHKPMDGKTVCFCAALRVQKGISKG